MDIRINELSKSYNGKKVLDKLTALLPDGEITVLTGASGSGKTTLANILLGLEHADAGKIEGIDSTRLSAVFQEDRLCEQLTGLGNIRLVMRQKAETKELLSVFAEVGLTEDDAKKPVRELSGGQKRRITILRAMLAESDFLCLDEPFQGMDKDTKEKTMAYVKKAIVGKTVLLITHDSREAEYFGGQGLYLNQIS
ncbi:MAG: ATP-binding cassette domain-containing protein [Eubacteriales bacterium]|nr:ATP-binding cassette domain-containing protein [Eubacteriales bacterium]MDD3350631.1 ATP-binding cassette domain-containing protein [Eubacteriales bacterium]